MSAQRKRVKLECHVIYSNLSNLNRIVLITILFVCSNYYHSCTSFKYKYEHINKNKNKINRAGRFEAPLNAVVPIAVNMCPTHSKSGLITGRPIKNVVIEF